jgi:hypothetical protein
MFECLSEAQRGPLSQLVIQVRFHVDNCEGHIDAVHQGIMWEDELRGFGGLEAFARSQGSIMCGCFSGSGRGSSRKRKFLGSTLLSQGRYASPLLLAG